MTEQKEQKQREQKQETKHQKKKRSRTVYRMCAGTFLTIVLLLSAASLLKPDAAYSEEENRILSGFPEFSIESVADQRYMEELESYTEDQFIFRDFWIRLKVFSDLLLGKRELNGVYLGKEHVLIQIPSAPDEGHVQDNLAAMKQFAEQNKTLQMHLLIAPNAAGVMQDWLPKGAPVRDQSKDMEWIREQAGELIDCIDVTPALREHAAEGMYYKTDHHWTSAGAKTAFEAAAPQLGIENPLTEYEVYTVTTGFSGTLASKSGYHKVKDSIEIYAAKGMDVSYLVSDSDDEEKRPTVYRKEALQEKDKYQVFFGGNHAKVEIETANQTGRTLLVIKDSYANCFVPFLLPYYDEIVMIDPRYYYENIQTLIDNKMVTDVLFLYNMDTFMTDNSIADALSAE